ncbi:hypothetical protein HPB48_003887 [Haemaphysalis longicornis]|uniref:Uncharacterized protein n=1 Tax=Haemaphysalis longicornis TaxID=44386 RepID=A0A9J6FFF1_HAELO|nr:hypothetical protein HPB48_003887 [Haemaphysalis longicornis]
MASATSVNVSGVAVEAYVDSKRRKLGDSNHKLTTETTSTTSMTTPADYGVQSEQAAVPDVLLSTGATHEDFEREAARTFFPQPSSTPPQNIDFSEPVDETDPLGPPFTVTEFINALEQLNSSIRRFWISLNISRRRTAFSANWMPRGVYVRLNCKRFDPDEEVSVKRNPLAYRDVTADDP